MQVITSQSYFSTPSLCAHNLLSSESLASRQGSTHTYTCPMQSMRIMFRCKQLLVHSVQSKLFEYLLWFPYGHNIIIVLKAKEARRQKAGILIQGCGIIERLDDEMQAGREKNEEGWPQRRSKRKKPLRDKETKVNKTQICFATV